MDLNATIAKYDMECWGIKGDGECSVPAAAIGQGFTKNYTPEEKGYTAAELAQ